MKILFVGTVQSSYKKLKRLTELNENVVGVITLQGSSFNSDFVDLVPLCKDNNIPFIFPKESINEPEIVDWIRKKDPDVIFCFGWSQLIKKEILEIPKIGVVGYHPAYLPKNRGRHPLIWALALGLEKTASTFFMMDEGADSGDIISQEKVDILYEDDAKSLYNKTVDTALKQICEFIPLLKSGQYELKKQDHSQANYWRKRSKRDGCIDFRMSSKAIYNLVRGLTQPYIGAHINYNKEEIKVWRVIEVKEYGSNLEPGKVISVDEKNHSFDVKCVENAIRVLEHEFVSLPSLESYF